MKNTMLYLQNCITIVRLFSRRRAVGFESGPHIVILKTLKIVPIATNLAGKVNSKKFLPANRRNLIPLKVRTSRQRCKLVVGCLYAIVIKYRSRSY